VPDTAAVRARSAAPLVLGLLLLGATRAGADLLLNEVLYDPDGPDEGLEFVELWNPDSIARSLDGVLVEAGDGSRPGTWTPLFSGTAGDSVPPGAAWLIDGTALRAAIQNGPDALRLTREGVPLDLLGYGALTAPELYRGSPAVDVPSGQSLARVRDGEDTGSNASDWAAEPEPTPGRANHPTLRLTIARGSARLDPETPWPGEASTLSLLVRNRGRLAVEAERWEVLASIRRPEAPDTAWSRSPAALAPGTALTPGDSAIVRCPFLAPAEGRFDLRVILRARAESDAIAIGDTILLRSRSGAGPLLVNEIAFRDRGAGEWVELIAREAVSDLGAYSLSDAGGRAYRIEPGSASRGAGAGQLFVLAEFPVRVRDAYGVPENLVLGCAGGWPALNDTDDDDGIADRVRILDGDGIAADAVPYRAGTVERGGSLERLGASLPSTSPNSWAESIDPFGGTPGRPNSMHAPSPEGASDRLLVASPRVLRRRPGAPVEPIVLSFGAVARGARVRVLVHDLLGRTRRHLIEGHRVLGPAAFVWDGRDDRGAPVPAGVYIARAETIPDGAEPARSGNLALTVIER